MSHCSPDCPASISADRRIINSGGKIFYRRIFYRFPFFCLFAAKDQHIWRYSKGIYFNWSSRFIRDQMCIWTKLYPMYQSSKIVTSMNQWFIKIFKDIYIRKKLKMSQSLQILLNLVKDTSSFFSLHRIVSCHFLLIMPFTRLSSSQNYEQLVKDTFIRFCQPNT